MPQNPQTPPSGSDVASSDIFKKFLGKAEGYIRQPTRMKQLLTDAYHKASEKNEVGTLAHEAWETLQTLFRLIKASMSGEYTGVPGTTVAAAVAVLIYFLSPIDLIPDFIPVLGLLDDVALVAWFSTTLKSELDKFHEWETTRPALVAATIDHSHKEAAEKAAAAMSSTPTSATVMPEHPEPARESAKNAGTVDLPGNPATQSNTDSGLGSPESSSPRPVHEAGPDATPSDDTNGPTVRAWEGSRNGTDASNLDTGGNVR
ncbi:hypothetical protein GCM10023185_11790 [Hymenobacter saemangeumensis]|uniref:DUF1232 domain-containing protein n=1 Tax=Hymenobacter saemangeumensis TaxID=1084522 RepID=A0ABP8I685_9BACT